MAYISEREYNIIVGIRRSILDKWGILKRLTPGELYGVSIENFYDINNDLIELRENYKKKSEGSQNGSEISKVRLNYTTNLLNHLYEILYKKENRLENRFGYGGPSKNDLLNIFSDFFAESVIWNIGVSDFCAGILLAKNKDFLDKIDFEKEKNRLINISKKYFQYAESNKLPSLYLKRSSPLNYLASGHPAFIFLDIVSPCDKTTYGIMMSHLSGYLKIRNSKDIVLEASNKILRKINKVSKSEDCTPYKYISFPVLLSYMTRYFLNKEYLEKLEKEEDLEKFNEPIKKNENRLSLMYI